MTESERTRLAETRRLIFTNLANGVPIEKVRGAFRLSEKEVMDHFLFVARAIQEYRFRRALTYRPVGTIQEAISGRVLFFDTLAKIGPVRLTSDHKLSPIVTTTVKEAADSGKVREMAAKQAEGGRQQAG